MEGPEELAMKSSPGPSSPCDWGDRSPHVAHPMDRIGNEAFYAELIVVQRFGQFFELVLFQEHFLSGTPEGALTFLGSKLIPDIIFYP